jgi:hypothetical protein
VVQMPFKPFLYFISHFFIFLCQGGILKEPCKICRRPETGITAATV